MISHVLINGQPSDGRLPVTDSSVLRGDGCFEVLRSYRGTAFALAEHLERLGRSAGALGIELPPVDDLATWIEKVAADVPEGAIRVVVTRGSSVPGSDHPSQVIVFGHDWPQDDDPARLLPIEAPWHAAGVDWDLAGAKVISYAPHLSATRRARASGFADALLMTTNGFVLEGPTFSVAWVVEGALETPALALGILDSITRRHVMRLARRLDIEVREGIWGLARLRAASEVMALSTIREVQPVVAVGDLEFIPGPVTDRLGVAFGELTG